MLFFNSLGGVVQFFDCDVFVEMVKVVMEGFQEFMVKLDNLDKIIVCLDCVVQCIYK